MLPSPLPHLPPPEPDSKIEYVFTDVEGKVATHAEDVLATVAKLQSS